MVVASAATILLLGGCGTTISTPLPDVAQMPDRSDYGTQRARAQQAIDDLNAKRDTHQGDAVKAIEQTRR